MCCRGGSLARSCRWALLLALVLESWWLLLLCIVLGDGLLVFLECPVCQDPFEMISGGLFELYEVVRAEFRREGALISDGYELGS